MRVRMYVRKFMFLARFSKRWRTALLRAAYRVPKTATLMHEYFHVTVLRSVNQIVIISKNDTCFGCIYYFSINYECDFQNCLGNVDNTTTAVQYCVLCGYHLQQTRGLVANSSLWSAGQRKCPVAVVRIGFSCQIRMSRSASLPAHSSHRD